jgi:radical SAM-linked protein
MGNPEPIADFIDAFVVGDGEESIVNVCTILDQARQTGLSKQDKLIKLSECKGVYVPALFPVEQKGLFLVPSIKNKVVQAAKVAELKDEYYPTKPLVPLMDVVHHRLAIEVLRGCTRGCRFCAAGISYRPVRERNVSQIINHMTQSLAETGWQDVGLLSLSTADYSNLTSLLHQTAAITKKKHIKVSLPSTRIDALSDTDLNALQATTPFSSFTVAPEAGTQRLRNVINKGFTDQEILATVQKLLERGIQTIKLYFMIGLPTEEMEDMDGIISLIQSISNTAWQKSHRVSINVSISPFSPKPHTPFQWAGMDSNEISLAKAKHVKAAFKKIRNVKITYREPLMSILETVMARGDRRIAPCIVSAWENGALFDGRDEHFNFTRWEKAFQDHDVPMEIFCNEIPVEQQLPWQAVSLGVSHDFLLTEREAAFVQVQTPDCRNGNCGDCGLCNTTISTVLAQVEEELQKALPVELSQEPQKKERYCYRFSYRKSESLRFLGHLDMVDVFHRAFLAAKLPIAFTEGFHAHAQVAFGPPLSLALAAENDLFDMTTTENIVPDINHINRFLPGGLCINSYKEIFPKHLSLNQGITAGSYRFALITDHDQGALPLLQMQENIASFLSRESFILSVDKKGTVKDKNIRPLVHTISLQHNESTPTFEAILSMEPNKTCKPIELLRALFPEIPVTSWMVTRKECLMREF